MFCSLTRSVIAASLEDGVSVPLVADHIGGVCFGLGFGITLIYQYLYVLRW
jgi:hypothetical protein